MSDLAVRAGAEISPVQTQSVSLIASECPRQELMSKLQSLKESQCLRGYSDAKDTFVRFFIFRAKDFFGLQESDLGLLEDKHLFELSRLIFDKAKKQARISITAMIFIPIFGWMVGIGTLCAKKKHFIHDYGFINIGYAYLYRYLGIDQDMSRFPIQELRKAIK